MDKTVRELRIGSALSVVLSLLLVALSALSLAGSSSSPKETNLGIAGLIVGVLLTGTAVLYVATEEKKIGRVHGTLMALAAGAIFSLGIRCLPDQKQWSGGFVGMVQVPVAGGLILFSLAAAGSAFQTFLYASERKKPTSH